MLVAVARLGVYMPFAHSLKEKRNALRRIKDRARSVHDVRLAEVGGQDSWQSAQLGFALVGTDRVYLEAKLDKVVRFVEELGMGEVVGDDREIFQFDDAAYLESGQ